MDAVDRICAVRSELRRRAKKLETAASKQRMYDIRIRQLAKAQAYRIAAGLIERNVA